MNKNILTLIIIMVLSTLLLAQSNLSTNRKYDKQYGNTKRYVVKWGPYYEYNGYGQQLTYEIWGYRQWKSTTGNYTYYKRKYKRDSETGIGYYTWVSKYAENVHVYYFKNVTYKRYFYTYRNHYGRYVKNYRN